MYGKFPTRSTKVDQITMWKDCHTLANGTSRVSASIVSPNAVLAHGLQSVWQPSSPADDDVVSGKNLCI